MELQELYSYIQEHQPNICQISVLRGGNEICSAEWNGQRIVSSEWLREMFSPRIIESGAFRGKSYGYLWWSVHPEKNIYAAIGDSGNVIYVDTEEQTIVAVSSYFRPTEHDRVDFIEHILLPNIQNH